MRRAARIDGNHSQIGICMQCGSPTSAIGKNKGIFCSRKCAGIAVGLRGVLRDRGHTVGKICEQCGKRYRDCLSRRKRFCSRKCFGLNRSTIVKMGYYFKAGRKDGNHNIISDEFKKLGAAVLDCSSMGHGFPDLIVGYKKLIHLVEIKSPENPYGKRGFNKCQQEWNNAWNGEQVFIVRTLSDVASLLKKWDSKCYS